MTVEENLKTLILSRYKSIREFTIEVGIPYTTLDSIFRRGVGNSSVSNVIKVCKALRISADELAEGRIVSTAERAAAASPRLFEVDDILATTKASLIHSENLTLGGEPVDEDTIDTLIQGLEVSAELAKRHNKNHNKNEVYNKTDSLVDG